jgi:hemoglobin
VVGDELDIPDATEADQTAAESAEPAAPERDPAAMDPAPADPSLRPVLEQFGGEPGLVALMDLFMTKLVADPRTKPFFENADQASVKKHLVEQFCVILGGNCTYTGRDMRTAHKNFNIDRAQFNALVECLQQAMTERKIPFRAQNQLLAKLAPLHRVFSSSRPSRASRPGDSFRSAQRQEHDSTHQECYQPGGPDLPEVALRSNEVP